MTGIRSMREKNKGIMDAIDQRRANGEVPVGKPIPGSPLEARTAPGRMFGLQATIQAAETRAANAEAELAALRQSGGTGGADDTAALAIAAARVEEAEAALKEAETALQAALKDQPARKALLSDLHEVPGRRRVLSKEQYEELRENLRSNPLANPIAVRTRAAGGFEVIAGHNRISCYRDLGRTEIAINQLDLNDDETERAAFYSNLLAPALPDYEKYIGFKARMMHKNLNQAQIAAEAGVVPSAVSLLLSFDDLPPDALLVIASARELFGAAAVYKLAIASRKGKGEKVTEAIQKIAAGELTQAAAVKFVDARPATDKPVLPKPVIIKQGARKYCEIRSGTKNIRLEFATQAEADAGMAAVIAAMQQLAVETRE